MAKGRSSRKSKARVSNASLLHRAVESYVSYYASGPGHTARAKRLDLKKFITFLQDFRGVSSPQKLSLADWDFSSTQRFIDHSLGRGESPATVTLKRTTVVSWPPFAVPPLSLTVIEIVASPIRPATGVSTNIPPLLGVA